MYAGRIVERAPTRELFNRPRMPYTEGLLAAAPKLGHAADQLRSIDGRPPNMLNPPPGCRFHPRCERATERCAIERPAEETASPGHTYECRHPLPPGGVDGPEILETMTRPNDVSLVESPHTIAH